MRLILYKIPKFCSNANNLSLSDRIYKKRNQDKPCVYCPTASQIFVLSTSCDNMAIGILLTKCATKAMILTEDQFIFTPIRHYFRRILVRCQGIIAVGYISSITVESYLAGFSNISALYQDTYFEILSKIIWTKKKR